MRAGRKHLDHVLDCLAQILLRRAQLEPSGGKRRKIDQVLDQLNQGVAGLLHAGEIVLLLFRQPRLGKQPAHAEDAGERGTDFVTDGGEQTGLRPARLLGAPPRLLPPACRQHFLGNIASDAVAHQPAARRVADMHVVPVVEPRARGRIDMHKVAVWARLRLEAQSQLRAGQPSRVRASAKLMEGAIGLHDPAIRVADDGEIAHGVMDRRKRRGFNAMPCGVLRSPAGTDDPLPGRLLAAGQQQEGAGHAASRDDRRQQVQTRARTDGEEQHCRNDAGESIGDARDRRPCRGVAQRPALPDDGGGEFHGGCR